MSDGTLPAVPSHADVLPAVLHERYRIERRLGAGGMGIVYGARDLQLERGVAIKLVGGRRFDSDSEEARLRREARAMASLRHPNIVTVYDIAASEGRVFVVMELVDGGTLGAWQRASTRSWRQIVEVYLQAARGLAAAHAAGVVHRDFKPDNVLLGEDGVARVTDFGVARLVGEARGDEESESERETAPLPPTVTGTGAVVGTPGYIAPEILRHEPIDARADQFSFCVALYAALEGERPFEPLDGVGKLTESLGQLRTPRGRAVPRWLRQVVARGLDAEPARRWPSMGTLIAAVEGRLTRRRRALIASGAALLLATAAVAIATQRDAPERPRRISDLRQEQVTFDGNARRFGLSPDGKTLAYVSGDHLRFIDVDNHREVEFDHKPPDTSYLSRYARWLPDSSAFEIVVLKVPAQQHGLRIPRTGGEAEPVRAFPRSVYSPDGMEVAEVIPYKRQITIRRGDEVVGTLPVSGSYDFLQLHDWSPDGQWLLIATTKQLAASVWTIARNGKEQVHLFDYDEGEYRKSEPRFSAGGEGVMLLSPHSQEEQDLMLLPLNNGRPAGPRRTLIEGIQADNLSVSRDGTRLAYLRNRPPSKIWKVTVGAPESSQPHVQARRLLADAAPKLGAAISRDGQRIAYIGREGLSDNVFVVGRDGGLPRRLGSPLGNACAVAFSPDGSEIALVARDSRGELSAWIASVSDGRTRRLAAIPSECLISWAPLEAVAVSSSANRNFTVIDPRTQSERRLLQDEARGWAFDVTPSPDGTWIALYVERRDFGGLMLVSPDGQVERPILSGLVFPHAWSTDGEWIYASIKHTPDNEPMKTIYRVPVRGGEAQPWVTLPIDENIETCVLSGDARDVVCVAGGESDVWMIRDFDQVVSPGARGEPALRR